MCRQYMTFTPGTAFFKLESERYIPDSVLEAGQNVVDSVLAPVRGLELVPELALAPVHVLVPEHSPELEPALGFEHEVGQD